jgi:hypothetical protein
MGVSRRAGGFGPLYQGAAALLVLLFAPSLSQYFRLAEDIGGVCLVTFLLP